MASKYYEEDLSRIRPISIQSRRSKVEVSDFVDPEGSGEAAADGLAGVFPRILKGAELARLVDAVRAAREQKREIIWLLGAHVLKCGLSYYVTSLVERGFVTGIATTGSATVHDLELAFFGRTSEDVAVELPAGRFGMAEETAAHFKLACEAAGRERMGLGEGLGCYVVRAKAPHARVSVYRCAFERSVPATVHVALGTDITHQHPAFPAALVGELSMRDFRVFTSGVGRLFAGGVVILFGSAVILPEVFLKAVSIGYNLGRKPSGVTAAAFDMIQHYRVRENVLSRPFQGAGTSYSFVGHHEIMLPLFYHLLVRG